LRKITHLGKVQDGVKKGMVKGEFAFFILLDFVIYVIL